MTQLVLQLVPPPAPAFGNFVAGRNAEALEWLRAMAAGGASERFAYLWGLPGSGRTHLLKAFAEAAGACYVAAEAPLAHLPGEGRLAVDDVDRLDADGQAALFRAWNELRDGGGSLVASGPVPPAQLGFREDLATRLAWGLVYQVHPLADEEKALALQRHAEGRGMRLPPEVAGYLLTHGRRDLPALMAIVDALDRLSLEAKRPVTLPLVREAMQATLPVER